MNNTHCDYKIRFVKRKKNETLAGWRIFAGVLNKAENEAVYIRKESVTGGCDSLDADVSDEAIIQRYRGKIGDYARKNGLSVVEEVAHE